MDAVGLNYNSDVPMKLRANAIKTLTSNVTGNVTNILKDEKAREEKKAKKQRLPKKFKFRMSFSPTKNLSRGILQIDRELYTISKIENPTAADETHQVTFFPKTFAEPFKFALSKDIWEKTEHRELKVQLHRGKFYLCLAYRKWVKVDDAAVEVSETPRSIALDPGGRKFATYFTSRIYWGGIL